MSDLDIERATTSRRRIPPARQIAGVDPAPVLFWVRAGNRTTEIASAEDWQALEPQLFDDPGDAIEVWAGNDQMANLIYPPERSDDPETALRMLARQLDKAQPIRNQEEDEERIDLAGDAELWMDHKLTASAYDPPAGVDSIEARYREQMGNGPMHLSPDGPIDRGQAAA